MRVNRGRSSNLTTVLFIGDIVGKAGRQTVKALVPELKSEYSAHLVIANGENAAGGFGLTAGIADELFAVGIDVLTSGNHIWQQKDILDYIIRQPRLIRPLNCSPDAPGNGSCLVTASNGVRVAVINLLGRVFVDGYSCPFRAVMSEVERLREERALLFVDFHAEATAEKRALGWYLDGHVSAVIGTHTHVQTADEEILPQGTAYLTDAGMTGAMDSVIGVQKELAIRKFLTAMPVRFEAAEARPELNGVVMTFDAETHHAATIERISRPLRPKADMKGGNAR